MDGTIASAGAAIRPRAASVAAAPPRGCAAMTIDVEDWFQVQAYADVIGRSQWDGLPRRVEANTVRLLDLFGAAGVVGTFFVLGWVADRHPGLVRRIVAGGHEIASHGYGHALVDTLGEAGFRADVTRARQVLEDVSGVAVRGYRAPTFSMGPRTPWAWAVLADTGHAYSSSTYPIRHDRYGDPDGPREPYQRDGVWELPMSTVRIARRNVPVSGGGWFRLAPYALFRLARQRLVRRGERSVFYLHPWEIDPGQPDVPDAKRLTRFRHRVNLGRTEARLAALLADFSWDRMDRVFPEVIGTAAGT